jgi:Putative MetA-pathway of phenol degradation
LRFANNPFVDDSGNDGFGDTALGFKYRLTQDSGRLPSIALMYMAKLPTTANAVGSGKLDHAFTLLASKDLGKQHFDFNLIASLLGRPQGGYDRSYLNALAWSHPIRGKWGSTAELSGTTSPNPFIPAAAQFLASGTYTPQPRLVLDFGMAGRITGNIPDAMFIAGFTYSIADLYRH